MPARLRAVYNQRLELDAPSVVQLSLGVEGVEKVILGYISL